MFCRETLRWQEATSSERRSCGSWTCSAWRRNSFRGTQKLPPSNYKGFIDKMDLGSLLRCSVEEKGQWTSTQKNKF